MVTSDPPVLIAYDGSDLARAGIRQAAKLFPGRSVIVATIWEPGLSTLSMGTADPFGGVRTPPDPEAVEAVDQAQREHASQVAQEGADLARSLELAAEPHAVPDDVDVADTLIQVAHERGAAGIVLGSHGVKGLRSHLVGSVARKLIGHCDLPVVVVRGDTQ